MYLGFQHRAYALSPNKPKLSLSKVQALKVSA